MTILAFLQNLWVKDPQQLRDILDRNPHHRLDMIRRLLFCGCLTGRRIISCFGEDLVKHMIFEETTREIAGDARTILPPDPEHIRGCLENHRPKIVLAFGDIARKAVLPVWSACMPAEEGDILLFSPHPAARQADTVAKLQAVAGQLRGMLA